MKIAIRSTPTTGKSEPKRAVVFIPGPKQDKVKQKGGVEMNPNVIEADSSTVALIADNKKSLPLEQGNNSRPKDDDRSNSPLDTLVISCDEVLDYEPDSGNESKSVKSLFSDSESDSETESYRKKLFTRTSQEPPIETVNLDDAHDQADSCEVSSSFKNGSTEDSNEGNFQKSSTPSVDEEKTRDIEKRGDVCSVNESKNTEVTLPAIQNKVAQKEESNGIVNWPAPEMFAGDNSLPITEPPICWVFWHTGKCRYKNCRYKHEQGALLPQNPEVPEITQEEFEETCKNGVLNKAVEQLQQVPFSFDQPAKMNMLITFTRTAIELNQLSKLKHVVTFFCLHKVRDSDSLSDIVILCTTKQQGTRDFLMQVIHHCKSFRLNLNTAAIEVVRHAFEDEEDLWKVVAVLYYVMLTCRQSPPMNLVHKALIMLPEQPSQVPRMFKLMCYFHESVWNQLSQDKLSLLLDMLQYNPKYTEEAMMLEKKIAHIHASTMIHNPSQWVQNVITGGRWSELADQFRTIGTDPIETSIAPEIHAVLLRQGEQSAECFSHFACAVTEDGKYYMNSRQYQVLGLMGTALMLENHYEKRYPTAFQILVILHQYNIDYYRLQKPVLAMRQVHGPREALITPCQTVLVAVEVCVEVKDYLAAVTVFKGCDWIQPSNQLMVDASYEEILWRARVLKTLSAKLFETKELNVGLQVFKYLLATISEDLADEHNKVSIQVLDLENLFPDYMRAAIEDESVEAALELFDYYKKMDIMLYLSDNALRALFILCWSSGKTDEAKHIFTMLSIMRIYTVTKPLPNSKSLKIQSDLTNEEILLHMKYFFQELNKIFWSQQGVFEERFTVNITISASQPSTEDEMAVLSQITPSIPEARKRVIFVLENLQPPITVINSPIPDMVKLDPRSVYEYFVHNGEIYKPIAPQALSPRIKPPPTQNNPKKTTPNLPPTRPRPRLNPPAPLPQETFNQAVEVLNKIAISNPELVEQFHIQQTQRIQKLPGVSPVVKGPKKTSTVVARAAKSKPTGSVLLGTNSASSQPSGIIDQDLSLTIISKKGNRTIGSPVPVAGGSAPFRRLSGTVTTNMDSHLNTNVRQNGNRTIKSPVPVASNAASGSAQFRRLSGTLPTNTDSQFNTNVRQNVQRTPTPQGQQPVIQAANSCNSDIYSKAVEFLGRKLCLQKQCLNVDARARELAMEFLRSWPHLTSLDKTAMKKLNDFAIIKII